MKNILIVDDEIQILTVIERILNKIKGLNITTTPSRKEALLLLTDISMPEISGYTLINKAREVNPGIKVIAMSGDFKPEKNTDYLFLSKPFEVKELKSIIEK